MTVLQGTMKQMNTWKLPMKERNMKIQVGNEHVFWTCCFCFSPFFFCRIYYRTIGYTDYICSISICAYELNIQIWSFSVEVLHWYWGQTLWVHFFGRPETGTFPTTGKTEGNVEVVIFLDFLVLVLVVYLTYFMYIYCKWICVYI